MKKQLMLAVALLGSAMIMAQSNVSAPISVNIVKEVIPPILNIIPGSLEFVEPSNNQMIDANETCHIRFKVKNSGKGDGYGCEAKISAVGTTSGLTFSQQKLQTIAAGSTTTIDFPITGNMQTKDGSVTFTMKVEEPMGFGTDPVELTVSTKAFVSPMLKIVDYAITSEIGSSVLEKKTPFNLQLMLQNTQHGIAENIQVEIVLPENVYITDGEKLTKFAAMDAGASKSLDYSLIVNNNYSGTTIPVQVKVKEKYGKYAENRTINLQLNQTFASAKLNVQAVEQQQKQIELASLKSSVDKNIPVTTQQSKNTFAVIIANENYQKVENVAFALNDGNIFREYCEKTLGIPKQNIHYVSNATGNNIKGEINWLKNVLGAYNGKAKVVFYYAGHGIPDESSRTAYLLPIDGNGSDVSTGYKLDNLYAELGSMPSESVTIFMDACFSGSKRDNGMLTQARGVAIKAKSGQPQGNMVVFSAAQGDETAYPNKNEGHGMFTYFLLKKLQETKGDVTLQELGEYIRTNVRQQSVVLNGKPQTPTVSASAEVSLDWQTWKLK